MANPPTPVHLINDILCSVMSSSGSEGGGIDSVHLANIQKADRMVKDRQTAVTRGVCIAISTYLLPRVVRNTGSYGLILAMDNSIGRLFSSPKARIYPFWRTRSTLDLQYQRSARARATTLGAFLFGIPTLGSVGTMVGMSTGVDRAESFLRRTPTAPIYESLSDSAFESVRRTMESSATSIERRLVVNTILKREAHYASVDHGQDISRMIFDLDRGQDEARTGGQFDEATTLVISGLYARLTDMAREIISKGGNMVAPDSTGRKVAVQFKLDEMDSWPFLFRMIWLSACAKAAEAVLESRSKVADTTHEEYIGYSGNLEQDLSSTSWERIRSSQLPSTELSIVGIGDRAGADSVDERRKEKQDFDKLLENERRGGD